MSTDVFVEIPIRENLRHLRFNEAFKNGARTFLSANQEPNAGWKTRTPVIDLSAVAAAKAEAEALVKDKALKEILEELGV
jgi:hypothetical protein